MSDNTQKTNEQILQQHQAAKEQIDQFVAGATGTFNANDPNQRLIHRRDE